MRIAVILIIGIFLTFPVILFAQPGSASFIFLRISAGSRPAALAEAVTASGNDITSSFYNPALLRAFDGKNQAAFMYNSYFKDVSQNYFGLGFKGKKMSIGGYLSLGRVADIQRWEDPDTVSLGTFEENNFIGALTTAYSFEYFDMGISVKYAYEKIDYATANSFMVDVGIYKAVTEEIRAGAAVKNIGGKTKFVSESYPLAREFRLGVSYKPSYFENSLEVLGDAVFYSDIDTKFNFGVEYNYRRSFTLRSGYGLGYDSRGISFGGGVNYRQFTFDYAFVNYKNDLGNTHRFTVGVQF